MSAQTETRLKYRDFSEMPDDVLRSLANAMREVGDKARLKEEKRRRSRP